MSEVIKSTFINYMFCAVTGGILEYLAPDKSKKTMRIILVAVILAVTLSPVLKVNLDFNLPQEEEYAADLSYEDLLRMRNLLENKIRKEMREILINEGVDEYEIYITTDADEESGTIYLDEVKIEVGNEFAHLTEQIRNKAPEEYRSVVEVGVKDG